MRKSVACSVLLLVLCLGMVSAAGIDQYTKLALHLDGDASFSNNSVTFYGTPVFEMRPANNTAAFGGSLQLASASGERLSIPDSDNWYMGTGNYTIDFWLRKSGDQPQSACAVCQWQSGVGGPLFIGVGSLNDHIVVGLNSVYPAIDSGYDLPDQEWHHIAVVRNGPTSTKLYIDGVQRGSTYATNYDLSNSNYVLSIGAQTSANMYNGLIDEVRISKGVARWTSGFTPPTSPYSPDIYTKLLLHLDGDASSASHNASINENATLSATQYKFNGSMYFDGSWDYVIVPDSPDWDLGTDDFTIDLWFYQTISTVGVHRGLISAYLGEPEAWTLESYDNQIYWYDLNLGVWKNNPSTHTLNEWHHVAIVREGLGTDEMHMFVDGIKVLDWTDSSTYSTASQLYVGTRRSGSTYYYWSGYIDEVRISKGIARWTSSFTPPSGPYDSSATSVPPTATNFTPYGNTTDFGGLSDWTSISGMALANNHGKIWFPGTHAVNADGEDYDSNVKIGNRFVSVNAAALDQSFNSTSNVSLDGVDCAGYVIYYGAGTYTSADQVKALDQECSPSICQNPSCVGSTLTFTAAHFTGYAVGNNSNLTIYDELEAGGTKYELDAVMFYANYTNITNGVHIASAQCNLSFDDGTGPFTMTDSGTQYAYNKTGGFAASGSHGWNVTCIKSGYNTLFAEDTVSISSSGGDVPEFGALGAVVALLAFAVGLSVLRRRA